MLLFEQWAGEGPECELITEYVFNLMNRLKRCHELTVENMTSREKRTRTSRIKCPLNGLGQEKSILDINYLKSIPGQREKSQIYHINLLKPYLKCVEKMNILICDVLDPVESPDFEIDFPPDDSRS